MPLTFRRFGALSVPTLPSLIGASAGAQKYTLTTLASFNNSTGGQYPTIDLTLDGAGSLSKTTTNSADGYGTVFESAIPAAISGDSRRWNMGTAAALAFGLLSVVGISDPARAQTTPVGNFLLQAQATAAGATASDTETQSVTTANAIVIGDGGAAYGDATAEYGVLHANAGSISIFNPNNLEDPLSDVNSSAAAAYLDIVLVQDSTKLPGTPISTTVTFQAYGQTTTEAPNQPDSLLGEPDASVMIGLAARFDSADGSTAIGSGEYFIAADVDNGTLSNDIAGVTSFTVSLLNDVTYQYFGDLSVSANSSDGGIARADYGDTAFFGISSTDPTVTYIGSQGTNYEMLTDTNNTGSVSAPEPVALTLFGLGGACLVLLRRKVV